MSRVTKTPLKNRPYYLSDSKRQNTQKYERHNNNVAKHRVSVPSRVHYMSPTPSSVTGKKNKKPWKNGRSHRTPFNHTEPYNYSATVPLKQYPLATSLNTPTLSAIASVDLISALAPGNTDNSRLGDTIVIDYLDINHICTLITNSLNAAAYIQDASYRMLIVGSKGAVRVDPLTSTDGFGTINNSIVTSDAMIFHDTGIFNLTPTRSGNGAVFLTATTVSSLFHNSVSFTKRISFHNSKAAGMFVQWNGGTLVAGSLYAIFYTNNPNSTAATVAASTSFSVGFRDYDPDITAGISDRVSVIESTLNSKIDEQVESKIEQCIESFLLKRALTTS